IGDVYRPVLSMLPGVAAHVTDWSVSLLTGAVSCVCEQVRTFGEGGVTVTGCAGSEVQAGKQASASRLGSGFMVLHRNRPVLGRHPPKIEVSRRDEVGET